MAAMFAINDISEGGSRRQSVRRMAFWSVIFQDLSGKWFRAKTDNVSSGGMQMMTDTAFPVGTKLFIKMPLVYREHKKQIEAIVETKYSVATSAGFKTGMMFTRITNADREFLRAYSEKEI
ncbi:PilZ domain-containing protein [Litoribrevibacter euphylliae]|uniref:PilZ domain-containing protein n=1 Tax=Litoribrevibacter euphylliae TaxID=1834034 RepID=A0ABV7HK61_9GAMM